ncbi:MAG: prepilin-type N-terminal cleavage/methylation domain-containing protein, partial [Pseudomonadales bacterium]
MSDDGRQSAGHEYQSGLSLIELIITIVVLAISLVGITFVINNSLSRSSDTLVQAQAVALAQAYLDEILGKRFDDNTRPSGIPPCRASGPPPQQCTAEFAFGPDGGETRAQFDDVDDYHGLDEGVGQANPIQD